jgi:hypothetical protein
MRMSRIAAPLIALVALLPLTAHAQLGGLYTLPKDDFIWNWGDLAEGQQRGAPDIEINGSESFFRCDLAARLRPASSRSPSDVRAIEMELRQRLDFIYAVSEAMNFLEYNRELQWATLDCKRQGEDNSSPEQRAERETAARDKMLRELERRRERQQRDED